jgi:siroheme synthase-like protein
MLTNLAQARCVVVAGAVAGRKARDLIAGGARPVVISPTVTDALGDWHAAGQIEHVARAYQPGDLAGAFLAVAATNDRVTNAAVAEEAARMGILINVADAPWIGNFHTAATVRHWPSLWRSAPPKPPTVMRAPVGMRCS